MFSSFWIFFPGGQPGTCRPCLITSLIVTALQVQRVLERFSQTPAIFFSNLWVFAMKSCTTRWQKKWQSSFPGWTCCPVGCQDLLCQYGSMSDISVVCHCPNIMLQIASQPQQHIRSLAWKCVLYQQETHIMNIWWSCYRHFCSTTPIVISNPWISRLSM